MTVPKPNSPGPKVFKTTNHVQYQTKHFMQSIGKVFSNNNAHYNAEVETLKAQVVELQNKIDEMTAIALKSSTALPLVEGESVMASKGLRLLNMCDKINIEKERILEDNRIRKLNPSDSNHAPFQAFRPAIFEINKSLNKVEKSAGKSSKSNHVRFNEALENITSKPEADSHPTNHPAKQQKFTIFNDSDKENSAWQPQTRRDSLDLPVEPKKLFSSVDAKRVKFGDVERIRSQPLSNSMNLLPVYSIKGIDKGKYRETGTAKFTNRYSSLSPNEAILSRAMLAEE